MLALIKRNFKLYFRDKTAVFFSLMSVFIVIGLYALFLGNSLLKSLGNVEGAETLMYSWLMAGILGVTSVTVTLGAFGVMVEDKYKKISKDFFVAPVKRWKLVGGYVINSILVGIIMTLFTLLLAEAVIVMHGGAVLSIHNLIRVVGLIILSVASSSSFIFFIVSFLKSQSEFATTSTIIGTLIGFLTGMYIPIGMLPEPVQFVIKMFPPSHASALLRQVFLEQPITNTFKGVPTEIINNFKLDMGVVYKFDGFQVNTTFSIMFLIITSVIFYGLSVISVSRKRK